MFSIAQFIMWTLIVVATATHYLTSFDACRSCHSGKCGFAMTISALLFGPLMVLAAFAYACATESRFFNGIFDACTNENGVRALAHAVAWTAIVAPIGADCKFTENLQLHVSVIASDCGVSSPHVFVPFHACRVTGVPSVSDSLSVHFHAPFCSRGHCLHCRRVLPARRAGRRCGRVSARVAVGRRRGQRRLACLGSGSGIGPIRFGSILMVG